MPSPYGQRRTRGSQVNVNPLADTDQNREVQIGTRDTEKYNFTDASYGTDFAHRTRQASDATVLANMLGDGMNKAAGLINQVTAAKTKAEQDELDAAKARMAKLKAQGASDQELNLAWESMGLEPGKYTAKSYHEYDATRQGLSDKEYSTDWNRDLQRQLNHMEERGSTSSEILSFLERKSEEMPELSEAYFDGVMGNYQRNVGAQLEQDRRTIILDETSKALSSYTVNPAMGSDTVSVIPAEYSTPQQIEDYLLAQMQISTIDDPTEWTDEYRIRIDAVRKVANGMASRRAQLRGDADRDATELQVKSLSEYGHYNDSDITNIGMDSAMQTEKSLRPSKFADALVSGTTGFAQHGGGFIQENTFRVAELTTLTPDQRVQLGLEDAEAYAEWQLTTRKRMMDTLRTQNATDIATAAQRYEAFSQPAPAFIQDQLGTLNNELDGTDSEFINDGSGRVGLMVGDEVITDPDEIERRLTETIGADAASLVVDQVVVITQAASQLDVATETMTQSEKNLQRAREAVAGGSYASPEQTNNVWKNSSDWALINGTASPQELDMLEQQYNAWAIEKGIDPELVPFDSDFRRPTGDNREMAAFMADRISATWREASGRLPAELSGYIRNLLDQTNDPNALYMGAMLYARLGPVKQGQFDEKITMEQEFLVRSIGADTRSSGGIQNYDHIEKSIKAYQQMASGLADASTINDNARDWANTSWNQDPANPLDEAGQEILKSIRYAFDDGAMGFGADLDGQSWVSDGEEFVKDLMSNPEQMADLMREISYTLKMGNAYGIENLDGEEGITANDAALYVISRRKAAGMKLVKTSDDERKFIYDPWGHTHTGADHGATDEGYATLDKTIGTTLNSTPDTFEVTVGDVSWNMDGMTDTQRRLYDELSVMSPSRMTDEQASAWEQMQADFSVPAASGTLNPTAAQMAWDLGFDEDDQILVDFAEGRKTYGEVLRERLLRDLESRGGKSRAEYEKLIPAASEWEVVVYEPGTMEYNDYMTAVDRDPKSPNYGKPTGGVPYRFRIPGLSEATRELGDGSDEFIFTNRNGDIATTYSSQNGYTNWDRVKTDEKVKEHHEKERSRETLRDWGRTIGRDNPGFKF